MKHLYTGRTPTRHKPKDYFLANEHFSHPLYIHLIKLLLKGLFKRLLFYLRNDISYISTCSFASQETCFIHNVIKRGEPFKLT